MKQPVGNPPLLQPVLKKNRPKKMSFLSEQITELYQLFSMMTLKAHFAPLAFIQTRKVGFPQSVNAKKDENPFFFNISEISGNIKKPTKCYSRIYSVYLLYIIAPFLNSIAHFSKIRAHFSDVSVQLAKINNSLIFVSAHFSRITGHF